MRRVVGALALAFSILLVAEAPASALKPFRFQQPPNEDLVVEGICDFPVLLHDVVTKVVITDFFDREGNLVREFFFTAEELGSTEGLMWFTNGLFVWRFDFATETWSLQSHSGTIEEACPLIA